MSIMPTRAMLAGLVALGGLSAPVAAQAASDVAGVVTAAVRYRLMEPALKGINHIVLQPASNAAFSANVRQAIVPGLSAEWGTREATVHCHSPAPTQYPLKICTLPAGVAVFSIEAPVIRGDSANLRVYVDHMNTYGRLQQIMKRLVLVKTGGKWHVVGVSELGAS